MSTVYPSAMTYFVIGNRDFKILLPLLVYRNMNFENYNNPDSYGARIYFGIYIKCGSIINVEATHIIVVTNIYFRALFLGSTIYFLRTAKALLQYVNCNRAYI